MVDAGVARCSRCGGRIAPNQKWHLDHADLPGSHERGVYLGPSHSYCNLTAARRPVENQPPAAALAFFHLSKPVERQHRLQVTEDKPPQRDWPF